MSALEPMTVLPSGTADAVLDALPHPVVMVSADGKIANANAAAEAFFEASLPLLRRHLLRDNRRWDHRNRGTRRERARSRPIALAVAPPLRERPIRAAPARVSRK